MKFKTKIRLAVAAVTVVALAALTYGLHFVDDPALKMCLGLLGGGAIGAVAGNVGFHLPRTMHRTHAWGPSPHYTYIEECSECGAWR